MQQMLNDMLYGGRVLRKQLGHTFVVLATLTLGIGANVAIFSAVNGLLLQPLPYPDADRVMQLWEYRPLQGRDRNTVSPADYLDWRARSTTFESMSAIWGASVSLTGDGEPEELPTLLITEDYFKVLRVEPSHGRSFVDQEFTDDAESAVVISDGLWQRRFGGAQDILGTKLQLDGEPYTVVGVMPAGFRFGYGRRT